MTTYIAPEGFVYDFANPQDDKHLYAKYLRLTRFDSIENYVLVEDPYDTENKN